MRAFALLLILANICFFFWAHYIDVPEAASRAAVMSAGKPPPRLLLAKERQTDADAIAARLTSELSCISVGPLSSATELQQLQARVQDAGFTSNARNEQGEIFAGYWVSLQGFATRADAEQAMSRLRAAGVTDAYILPEENPPNMLSLGVFSEQARAEQRREAIAKLGFQPQVQKRMRSGEVHWLDVTLQEPGQLLDPALLQPESGGIVRLETRACPDAAAVPVAQNPAPPPTSGRATARHQ
ncbi:MAG: SPOR domain-containing protein [Steroidobacteraceae bacterium]